MAQTDVALVPSFSRGVASVRYDEGCTVVWIGGEHDISTVAALSETLALAISVDDSDLVVDLGSVQHMGTSTIGVIVRAQSFLRDRSRSMLLRAPPPWVRRLLDACGLADMVEERVDAAQRPGALSSWIAVPVAARVDREAPDPLAPEAIEIAVKATVAT